ncbi:hypothetical protein ACGFNY_44390, partial [Streptomyces chartreusis]|uniref:hypothetical protein n=1 Tax=Streptomyces chartreusis TaxID=1969 RepID=UPI0037218D12
ANTKPASATTNDAGTAPENCPAIRTSTVAVLVLAVGLLAPSASADAPLGVEVSGEGLNINFDIAQTVWTVLVSTAIKPLCLNGAETPKDGAFVICPVTDEPGDTDWGIGGVPTNG